MNAQAMMNKIKAGQLDDAFRRVYVTDGEVAKQKSRYMELLTTFAETFGGDREVHLMSAPGRTEICGNHTDHNHGKVLAAAINLDAIAVASKNADGVVRVKSAGHQMNVADLADLAPNADAFGHSTAMVRGVSARLSDLGYTVGGYDAVTTSDVMGGSGLSSSAAFEVLLGTITSYL